MTRERVKQILNSGSAARIEKLLARLDDDDLNDVMFARFVQGCTWQEMADMFFCSKQGLHYKKNKAIALLASEPWPPGRKP